MIEDAFDFCCALNQAAINSPHASATKLYKGLEVTLEYNGGLQLWHLDATPIGLPELLEKLEQSVSP